MSARARLPLGSRRSSDARPGRRLGRGEHDASRRFEGSDRQARGRILATLVDGIGARDAFDPRILHGLVADGLVIVTPDGLASLP